MVDHGSSGRLSIAPRYPDHLAISLVPVSEFYFTYYPDTFCPYFFYREPYPRLSFPEQPQKQPFRLKFAWRKINPFIFAGS